jgi:hypothetical protein
LLRLREEWQEHRDESLRIVSEAVFAQAQQRMNHRPHERLKIGGKPKFRLSGWMTCAACGSNYVLSNADGYSCSGYLNGACSNGLRMRRDRVESGVLGDMQSQLLAPADVARTLATMKKDFAAAAREASKKAGAAPAELQAIDARLERLRERLTTGDPDMEPDEIQAAIDRAEAKRRELVVIGGLGEGSNVIPMLPNAAEAARRLREQVEIGLDDDPLAAEQARDVIRRLIPGGVKLVPKADGRELWAEGNYSPGAVLVAVGTGKSTPPLPLSPGSCPGASFADQPADISNTSRLPTIEWE